MGLANLWRTFRGDAGHVCPVWVVGTFDNRFRTLVHNPDKIFGDLVRPGMTVLDLGCGGGVFSIAMARMVGDDGRVIAVDVQRGMLGKVARRAVKLGLQDRIRLHHAAPGDIRLDPRSADFALASMMIHEVPDAFSFLSQVHDALKPESLLLILEPLLHVTNNRFRVTLDIARRAGFRILGPRCVPFSQAALLQAEK